MPSLSPALASNELTVLANTSDQGRDSRSIVSSHTFMQRFEDSTVLITETLGERFVKLLTKDGKIERVFWAFEESILRVWTFINYPDASLEGKISQAQLAFLDQFPELECDFTVIYRFDKHFDDLRPVGSILAFEQQ